MKFPFKAVKLIKPEGGVPTPDPMTAPLTGEIECPTANAGLEAIRRGEAGPRPDGQVLRSAHYGPEGFTIYLEDAPREAVKAPPKPRRKAPRG